MPSPFPGMDPYLEDPAHWRGIHTMLIATTTELLNQKIRPKYVAKIEERVYLVPDDDPEHEFLRIADVRVERIKRGRAESHRSSNGAVAIAEPVIVRMSDPNRERRIEIQEIASREVVTVIELLSPSNKLNGSAGREAFLEKRDEVTCSRMNWVEIDLLRTGIPHPVRRRFPKAHYLVYSSPKAIRPKSKVWPLDLRARLPIIGIPLRGADPDAPLDLQSALTLAYDRGASDATTDYTKDPVPPLPADLAKWSNKLLKQKKLR